MGKQLLVPVESSSWHRSEIRCGIEPCQWEVHDLVRLDPPIVHTLEAFQVDDQDWRQSPYLKLLDRELMGLASRAVVLLILAQFFLLSKSLEALGQGDGLSGSAPDGIQIDSQEQTHSKGLIIRLATC